MELMHRTASFRLRRRPIDSWYAVAEFEGRHASRSVARLVFHDAGMGEEAVPRASARRGCGVRTIRGPSTPSPPRSGGLRYGWIRQRRDTAARGDRSQGTWIHIRCGVPAVE